MVANGDSCGSDGRNRGSEYVRTSLVKTGSERERSFKLAAVLYCVR